MTRPEKGAGPGIEWTRLEKTLPIMAEHRADLLSSYTTAMERWWMERFATGGRRDIEPEAEASLHGDFYPAQILVRSGSGSHRPGLGFLDWDEACRGEPERDVGNFNAHLILEEARGHVTRAQSESYQSAFGSGYREVADLDERRLEWYRRASLLRLAALHARPGFGASPPNPESLANELLALVNV
jgi:aminoglycoside phosphotransferase (APT) family kinase protein